MMDWMKKLFGAAPSSSSTAKERLRLVLMTDHLALAPEIIDQMKRDLVDVISRYVEVDREKVEVNFEREDKALAMLANIPIKGVNRPGSGEPGEHKDEHVAQPQPAAAAPAAPAVAGAPRVASPGAEAAMASGAPPARKRRKRKGQQPSSSTAPPSPRTSPAF